MTQKNKELLLRDLSARLFYGVKLDTLEGPQELDTRWLAINMCNIASPYLPYLFPLSNMTKEQEDEWYRLYIQPLFDRLNVKNRKEDLILQAKSLYIGVDYLIANHFDYRGLIEKELAIDATGLNIYE